LQTHYPAGYPTGKPDSGDGVSRLGVGVETRLETHFCESRRFQVSSRSRRFQVSRLWLLQRNYYNFYTSVIFCMLYLHVNTTKPCRKNERNLKKIEVRSDHVFFFLFRQNAQILQSRVSVSVSNLKSLVSVSEFLMKSRSRSRPEILTRSRSRRLRSRPVPYLLFRLYRLKPRASRSKGASNKLWYALSQWSVYDHLD